MPGREPQVPSRTRVHPLDVLLIPAEIGVTALHASALGIPYGAVQLGADRALAAARTTGERMARVGLPDPMSVVVKEIEMVKTLTGMDSGSAIATVFVAAALIGADAGRRFRRAFGR